MRNVKVFNLCKCYRYQSLGYYVSLLASARGHKPVPNILAIQDLKSQAIIRIASTELDSLIQKSLKPIQGDSFTLSIYFGKNLAKQHNQLSQRLFAQFQAPLLRAEFIKKDTVWILRALQPIASNDVPADHKPFVKEPPKTLGFPLILKQPDSSFSQGVLKVDSMDEYITETENLFEMSDLLIAQKFTPTPFDWCIGILNGSPLYACRYHMARKHWQIYERTGDGKHMKEMLIPYRLIPCLHTF